MFVLELNHFALVFCDLCVEIHEVFSGFLVIVADDLGLRAWFVDFVDVRHVGIGHDFERKQWVCDQIGVGAFISTENAKNPA